jgi:di/tricarboxylate transporter
MTIAIAIVLAVLAVSIVLFSLERIPLEVSALSVVALLAVTGVLTPEQALAGFSNDTVILIFSLLAMTQGLASTGVVQLLGQRMAFFTRYGGTFFIAAMMVVVAAVSSVISNTVTTAALLPVVIGAADRTGVPRGRALMPLAYASIMGGTIFLIGTSTNLVVSSAMEGLGMPPIRFAELAPVGLPMAVMGIALTVLLGRWLLPARAADEDEDVPSREYLTEAIVTAGSRFAGKPLAEVTDGLGLRVLAVTRAGAPLEARPELALEQGDALLLEEDRLDILRVKDLRGLEMRADVRFSGGERDEAGAVLVEASVPVGSSLVGRSLKDAFFAEHFGLVALAIGRRPAIQRLTRMQLLHGLFGTHSLSTLPLAVGDVLLLRGPRPRVRSLAGGTTLTLLGNVEYQPARYRKAAIAVAIFLGVLVLGVSGVVPLSIAGLCGMLLMIAARCVDAAAAFRVDWRVVVLIGSMMALGTAMETTGAGRWLGSLIVPLAAHVGPRGVLASIMVLTIVLSAPMSNQAAALVLLPVAVAVAGQLGLDARPFAIAVCLSASCSFVTPLEPSCVLVYGPGRYRFADFVRMGSPLTLALLVLLTVVVPLRWPF